MRTTGHAHTSPFLTYTPDHHLLQDQRSYRDETDLQHTSGLRKVTWRRLLCRPAATGHLLHTRTDRPPTTH